jgi:hypothetical protein
MWRRAAWAALIEIVVLIAHSPNPGFNLIPRGSDYICDRSGVQEPTKIGMPFYIKHIFVSQSSVRPSPTRAIYRGDFSHLIGGEWRVRDNPPSGRWGFVRGNHDPLHNNRWPHREIIVGRQCNGQDSDCACQPSVFGGRLSSIYYFEAQTKRPTVVNSSPPADPRKSICSQLPFGGILRVSNQAQCRPRQNAGQDRQNCGETGDRVIHETLHPGFLWLLLVLFCGSFWVTGLVNWALNRRTRRIGQPKRSTKDRQQQCQGSKPGDPLIRGWHNPSNNDPGLQVRESHGLDP